MRTKFNLGITLTETLLVALILGLVAAMMSQTLSSVNNAWKMMLDVNPSVAEHRRVLDLMADHARNAMGCRNASSGVMNSVIASAKATEFTYYTDKDSCATVRYFLSSGNIVREEGGVQTVVIPNVTALQLTYFKSNVYHSTWTPTMAPSTPTQSELPLLAGIRMKVTTLVNGDQVTSDITTRFRNSPKKSRLDGL